MIISGTSPRAAAVAPPSRYAALTAAKSSIRRTRNSLSKFARPRFFALPRTLASAAARASRNAARFRPHYAVLQWIILLAVLAPRRRVALLLLMTSSKIAAACGVLLRAIPCCRSLDHRLAVALFLMITLVQLVLTDAVVHLVISLAVGGVVVGMHAACRVEDDLLESPEAVAATEKKHGGDVELGSH